MIGGDTDGERTELYEQHSDEASTCDYFGCPSVFENLQSIAPSARKLSEQTRERPSASPTRLYLRKGRLKPPRTVKRGLRLYFAWI